MFACEWRISPESNLSEASQWIKKVYRLTKITSQIPKKLAEGASSQHRPGLLVDGYQDKDGDKLKLHLFRKDRLSANVLLCLFEGKVDMVEIHLEPETLHFGLKVAGDIFSKDLKAENGQEIENKEAVITIQNNLWREGGNKVIEIAKFVSAIEHQLVTLQEKLAGEAMVINNIWKPGTKMTSAHFALQMIEGEKLVSFTRDALAGIKH